MAASGYNSVATLLSDILEERGSFQKRPFLNINENGTVLHVITLKSNFCNRCALFLMRFAPIKSVDFVHGITRPPCKIKIKIVRLDGKLSVMLNCFLAISGRPVLINQSGKKRLHCWASERQRPGFCGSRKQTGSCMHELNRESNLVILLAAFSSCILLSFDGNNCCHTSHDG